MNEVPSQYLISTFEKLQKVGLIEQLLAMIPNKRCEEHWIHMLSSHTRHRIGVNTSVGPTQTWSKTSFWSIKTISWSKAPSTSFYKNNPFRRLGTNSLVDIIPCKNMHWYCVITSAALYPQVFRQDRPLLIEMYWGANAETWPAEHRKKP